MSGGDISKEITTQEFKESFNDIDKLRTVKKIKEEIKRLRLIRNTPRTKYCSCMDTSVERYREQKCDHKIEALEWTLKLFTTS